MEQTDKVSVKLKTDKIRKSPTVVGFFSSILNSITQAHIYHLQSNSYAQHMALGSYYGAVGDLIDGMIETYQGKFGIVKGYHTIPVNESEDCCTYFKKLHNATEEAQSLFTDSDLLNQLDEIKSLIKTTIYKLEYLK